MQPGLGDCCSITILIPLDSLNYEERGFCVLNDFLFLKNNFLGEEFVGLNGQWKIDMHTLFPENQGFNVNSKKPVHRYARSCISMYLKQVFPAV